MRGFTEEEQRFLKKSVSLKKVTDIDGNTMIVISGLTADIYGDIHVNLFGNFHGYHRGNRYGYHYGYHYSDDLERLNKLE